MLVRSSGFFHYKWHLDASDRSRESKSIITSSWITQISILSRLSSEPLNFGNGIVSMIIQILYHFTIDLDSVAHIQRQKLENIFRSLLSELHWCIKVSKIYLRVPGENFEWTYKTVDFASTPLTCTIIDYPDFKIEHILASGTFETMLEAIRQRTGQKVDVKRMTLG